MQVGELEKRVLFLVQYVSSSLIISNNVNRKHFWYFEPTSLKETWN